MPKKALFSNTYEGITKLLTLEILLQELRFQGDFNHNATPTHCCNNSLTIKSVKHKTESVLCF